MKISVIGHEGRLGIALTKIGAVPLLCNILNKDEISAALLGARPDVIINCAAITDVNRCETDLKEVAIQVHVRGVQNLIDAAQNIPIVHISTDYIFNGAGNGQYRENARPSPINAYGLSKYASELILQASGCKYTIVRTTQLYGSDVDDFGQSVVNAVRDSLAGYFFSDVYGNPTNVDHLALGIMHLFELPVPLPKVINIAGQNWMSRMEFAEAISYIMGKEASFTPICYQDYMSKPGAVPRPLRAGLNLDLARRLGIPLFFAEDGIQLMLQKRGYLP